LISGRFPVSSGRIDLHGEDITGLEPHLINRKGLSRSFQITNIFPRLSVYENLRCAVLWSLGYKYSFWHRIGALKEVRGRTDEIVERIGMVTRRDRPAGVLTYAEQRALEIGVTIAGGADVILLDEPTAGMSRSETGEAVELIRNVTEGKTLVMVEHDMSVIFNLADHLGAGLWRGHRQRNAAGNPRQQGGAGSLSWHRPALKNSSNRRAQRRRGNAKESKQLVVKKQEVDSCATAIYRLGGENLNPSLFDTLRLGFSAFPAPLRLCKV
jgi:ABC-type branched-subunit amino acid transport system ATPase component